MTLALGVLPRHPLCDDLSGLMGLEVALHLPHVSVTAAPLPLLPCLLFTPSWVGCISAFLARLLIIGSFCCCRLMALSWNQCHSPGDWKITQTAKWHCRNRAVVPTIT